MAEVNTGMGWAANSDWLMQTAGTLATLKIASGGSDFPGQPVPVMENPSAVDVVNGGFYLGETVSYYNDRQRYYIASDSTMFVYCVVAAQYGPSVFIEGISDNNAGTMYVVAELNGNYYLHTITAYTPISGTSFYRFDDGSGYDGRKGYNLNCPYYNYETSSSSNFNAAAQDAASKITITENAFTKDNAGYAVACIAKWKTSAGVTFSTPVLISSVTELTDMSDASAQYNIAKLNILQDGMRFYMSFFDITGTPAITSALPVLDLSGEGEPPRTLETVFAYITDLNHAAILVLNSPDPYQEEGEASGEEGGDGEELEDDPVEEETLPVPSVAGHGFCTIYVPSSQELGQMASYLWSGAFDVDQVIKLFSNPMDSILGLSAVPVDLVGSPEQIYLGGVALTGITMPKYTGRTSIKVDFGTVTVAERWGSYLDYSPYTDFSIYLPFIGIKPIKADDIMGKTVQLMYDIDILSGGCVAYLRPSGGSVLYEWSGQCALQIPVTGRSYDNVFQSAMSVATAAVAAVAAPASAPVLSGAVASAAVQAAASKPHIERSGAVNGITGFLGQLRPYLIRTIPEAYIPADQNKFIGYPAYINVDLSNVVGYNEVDSIHLENVTATGAELDEIETILKGGVIF